MYPILEKKKYEMLRNRDERTRFIHMLKIRTWRNTIIVREFVRQQEQACLFRHSEMRLLGDSSSTGSTNQSNADYLTEIQIRNYSIDQTGISLIPCIRWYSLRIAQISIYCVNLSTLMQGKSERNMNWAGNAEFNAHKNYAEALPVMFLLLQRREFNQTNM